MQQQQKELFRGFKDSPCLWAFFQCVVASPYHFHIPFSGWQFLHRSQPLGYYQHCFPQTSAAMRIL
jgi:hypothetical protein